MRIVGGRWRRTPLAVADRNGLRPTPERVRETVFDWLGHLLGSFSGKSVLDLFAGSGALGFEALSRGMKAADFVERDSRQAALLKRQSSLKKRPMAPRSEFIREMLFSFLRGQHPITM